MGEGRGTPRSGDERVSAIIPYSPVHTPERMLDEAIESVERQSVPTDVIVVEDENARGPAWARNRGMERATTPYVAFLDADDLWRDGKLRRQIAEMRATGASLCVEGSGGRIDVDRFVRGVLFGSMYSLTSSILVDTDRVECRFNERLERYEDHLFVIEAALAGGVCVVDDIVRIRKHDRGLTATGDPTIEYESRLTLADELERIGVPDAAIEKMVRLARLDRTFLRLRSGSTDLEGSAPVRYDPYHGRHRTDELAMSLIARLPAGAVTAARAYRVSVAFGPRRLGALIAARLKRAIPLPA